MLVHSPLAGKVLVLVLAARSRSGFHHTKTGEKGAVHGHGLGVLAKEQDNGNGREDGDPGLVEHGELQQVRRDKDDGLPGVRVGVVVDLVVAVGLVVAQRRRQVGHEEDHLQRHVRHHDGQRHAVQSSPCALSPLGCLCVGGQCLLGCLGDVAEAFPGQD